MTEKFLENPGAPKRLPEGEELKIITLKCALVSLGSKY